MRDSWLALAIAGSRASDTRGRTPLCPQRRPPRPQHPVVGVFAEVVCAVGATPPRTAASPPRTAASPPPNGGNCTIRAATRRRHADRMLLMVQNPHHYPWRHAPARVERPRSGGIFPMGRILSEERRREQASLTTPPSTTPGTVSRPTRYAHNRRPVCARSGLLPPRRPGEGAPASLRGLRKRRAARLCPGLECSRGGRSR